MMSISQFRRVMGPLMVAVAMVLWLMLAVPMPAAAEEAMPTAAPAATTTDATAAPAATTTGTAATPATTATDATAAPAAAATAAPAAATDTTAAPAATTTAAPAATTTDATAAPAAAAGTTTDAASATSAATGTTGTTSTTDTSASAASSDSASAGSEAADTADDAALELPFSSTPQGIEQALAASVNSLTQQFEASQPQGIYEAEAMKGSDATAQWIAFDLYRLGYTDGSDAFLTKMETYVTQAYATSGALDDFESTVYDRVAIVVALLGGDPTAFGTDAAGKPVDLVAMGSYNWSLTDSIGLQGSNGWIYALESLVATGVEVPDNARYSEQRMIQELLAVQNTDGGFGLSAGSSGVDLTGMALAALAPYSSDEKVAQAIDRGLSYLSAQQGADGCFSTEEGTSSESCSMAIIGLVANGVDPATDTRFVKNGVSLLDGLLSFQLPDGSFCHTRDDTSRYGYLATEQATRALIACYELNSGGDGNVYTFDVTLQPPMTGGNHVDLSFSPQWFGIGAAAGVVAVLVYWLVHSMRRKKRLALQKAMEQAPPWVKR